MAKCSVGQYLKSIGERKTVETCKKKNYGGITKVSDLSAHEQSQLELRTGRSNLDTICGFHKKAYFENFNELFGSVCCDPLKNHHLIQKRLSIGQRIPLTVQHRATAPQFNLIPGKSLCKSCYQEVFRGKRVPKAKGMASRSKPKKKRSWQSGPRQGGGMLGILSRMFMSDGGFDEESDSEAELEDSEYLLDSLKEQNEADDVDADDENMGVAETYADYMPSKLKIGVKHPDPVVETASLSSVEPNDVWYKLSIPSHTIYSGALSALQLEAITYASQQHEKFLPDGSRAGFLIGDGAGVGKGRTIAGAIFENFLKGRKRSIWVSVSNDLKYDAERDLLDIGAGGKIDVHCLNKFKYADIASVTNKKVKDGVIFSTYSALIGRTNQSKSKYNTRLSQLLDWCGSDFDGIIVFDECHRAKNLVPAAGTKPTRTGETVLQLQQKLPKARVIYASATGASEPRNMAYMIRLGMWGEGTPFAEFGDFIDSVEKRGVGAMEIVAMDMKLRGTYIARQLSFQGVTFRIDDVPLSDECVKIYNDSVHLWVEAVNMFTEAIELLRSNKAPVMRMIWCQFWAAHQRFFKYLCIAFKVKRAVQLTRDAVKEGKCVVIGLQSTGEARTLAQLEKDDGELTDFVSSAKGVLENLVEKNFPAPGAPVIGKGKRSSKSNFKKTPKSAMKTPKIQSSGTKNILTPVNEGQKRKPLREAAIRAFKKVKLMIDSDSDSKDAEVKMEHSDDENCPPINTDHDYITVPKQSVKNPARDSGIQMSEDESFANKSSFLADLNDDDNKDNISADMNDNDKKDGVLADLDNDDNKSRVSADSDDEDVWSEDSDEKSSDSDLTSEDEKLDSEESDSDLSDSDVSEAEESDREDSDDSDVTPRVSKKKSSFGSAGSSTEPGSKKKTIQDRLDEILEKCRADRSEHSTRVLQAIDKTQKMKQELMEKIEKLGQRLPPATLDELIDELGGPKNVAEMTGRKGRVVSTPGGGVLYESRAEGDTPLETLNLAEKQMFMDGDKVIAIISEAASSGISIQSDRRAKNQKRRVHITLELPWSADRAIQQFGRTHRSNQVNAPEYIFMISDLAGERRFASIVAKRLESLGALTHADRRATETRDLSQYNMDNKYGLAALKKTGKIVMGKERPLVPLPKDYIGDFLQDVKDALVGVGLVISVEDEFGSLKLELVKDFHNISKFLNRILGTPVELQNRLFKYFTDILGCIIAAAKKNGTFDLGILDLGTAGDDVKRVHQYNFLRKHATGQATTELHTVHVQRGLSWQAAVSKWSELTGSGEGFYLMKNTRSGKQPAVLVIATAIRLQSADNNGAMSLDTLMTIYRPHTGMQMRREPLREIQKKFKKVSKDEAEPNWVEQYEASENTCSHAYWNGFCKNKAVSGNCEYGLRRRKYTVLSGSVLAVWDKVEKVLKSRDDRAKMQVIRLKTVDGSKLVGALIPNSLIGRLRAVLTENAEDTSEKTF